jgi:hypothetical protein
LRSNFALRFAQLVGKAQGKGHHAAALRPAGRHDRHEILAAGERDLANRHLFGFHQCFPDNDERLGLQIVLRKNEVRLLDVLGVQLVAIDEL